MNGGTRKDRSYAAGPYAECTRTTSAVSPTGFCLPCRRYARVYEAEWENKGSIVSADGMLYCYEEKGGNLALVKATPQKFDLISSFEIEYGKGPHWSHPMIFNKTLYIRHGKALMAYSLEQ